VSCTAEWTQVHGAARVPAQYAGAKRRAHLSGSSPCQGGLEHDREQQAGLLSLVGHPGLEPGANGLRTQRRTAHKAILLSGSDTLIRPVPVTKGHGSTYSGHGDRLDRDAFLRAIARTNAANIFTDDQAATLLQLIHIVDSP
jgi:hypothetical protein